MKITKGQLRRIIREVVEENQLPIHSVPNMIQRDIPGAKADPVKISGTPDSQWYSESLPIKLPSKYPLWADLMNSPTTYFNDETGEYYRGPSDWYSFWVHHPSEGGEWFGESEGSWSDISEIYPIFVDHAKEVIRKRNADPSYGEYD